MVFVAHTLDTLLCFFSVPIGLLVLIMIGAVVHVKRDCYGRKSSVEFPEDPPPRGFAVIQDREETRRDESSL